ILNVYGNSLMEKPKPTPPEDTTTGLPRLRKARPAKDGHDPTGHIPLDVLCAPLSAKHVTDRTITSGQGFLGPHYHHRIKGRN
ncbi:hypothetical protein, partial [Marivivens donghaensis]|uniref:hypothetical protein n=1 Tax=Marivivens donghaensis TaxID=1699413 RepID=UPI003F698A8C